MLLYYLVGRISAQSLEIGMVGDKPNKSSSFPATIRVDTHQTVDRGCALFRTWLVGVASIALAVAEAWFLKTLDKWKWPGIYTIASATEPKVAHDVTELHFRETKERDFCYPQVMVM